jgi:hypothetical protein
MVRAAMDARARTGGVVCARVRIRFSVQIFLNMARAQDCPRSASRRYRDVLFLFLADDFYGRHSGRLVRIAQDFLP